MTWLKLMASVSWMSTTWNKFEGFLYFTRKGNLKFSLSKWRVTSKIALHVCIEVFVESAHYHVYQFSMAQSIIKNVSFLPFILKGLHKITPSFLKGMRRVGPQNKSNSPSILFHGPQFMFMLCNFKVLYVREDQTDFQTCFKGLR